MRICITCCYCGSRYLLTRKVFWPQSFPMICPVCEGKMTVTVVDEAFTPKRSTFPRVLDRQEWPTVR